MEGGEEDKAERGVVLDEAEEEEGCEGVSVEGMRTRCGSLLAKRDGTTVSTGTIASPMATPANISCRILLSPIL